MFFFLPMFCRVFFLLLLFLLVKIVFSQTDYGPVFLCDARICSRVHIRGTRWCWRYRGDGAFFLSFFLSNTHNDRGRGVIKAACGNETKVDDLLLLLFYFIFLSFSLERHESQVPSCRVNASPPWWSHVVPVDVFHVRRRAAGRTKQSERRNWFPL